MRKTILSGGILAIAVALLFLLGSVFELEVESVALFGAALGTVVALVADRTLGARVGAFAAGFVIAWVGYIVRAALLPDSAAGRATAAVVIVVLCTVLSGALRNRLPLWAVLLGAVGLTGAYEYTYAAAPPELMTTSVETATAMLLSVGVGLFAASLADLFRDGVPAPRPHSPEQDDPADDTSRLSLDQMMETQK